MGILTEEMKRVVTEIQLCYAATVTPRRQAEPVAERLDHCAERR